MNFANRLINFRNDLNLNKKEMSQYLDVSESYYNLIENGKREPSKNILYTLVEKSGNPEEWWLYGIEKEEYSLVRNKFKSISIALEQIIDLKLVNDLDTMFTDKSKDKVAETLLIAAIKSDLSYVLKNKKSKT
ncbi:helix-turn-helix domain-containing protein [Clostridium tertium]|uniref:Helix-turn-helix domain-containing protein n=1 Tax=Clostridium tertium TaxID=1559 RepID=A0A9X3XKS3_9CLOT|nr:helix-turn-helix transcriptional regulator [Clostridium tertium]MDC4239864.1 helix-turn-helix domain-containing protein [Clostridium tertium]